jgi:hypothetical protein
MPYSFWHLTSCPALPSSESHAAEWLPGKQQLVAAQLLQCQYQCGWETS